MTPATWLFVKDGQSIWIERPDGRSMTVAGPGTSRARHDFPDEQAVEGYQMQLADRLASAGWMLWGVNRQRRGAPGRGNAPPATPDRRLRTAETDSDR